MILNFFQALKQLTFIQAKLSYFFELKVLSFLIFSFFITRAQQLNDVLFQEAYLIDFVQKKCINKWVQKFLIVSSYLFNERLVFDLITGFIWDFFLNPLNKLAIFEADSPLQVINWLFTLMIFCILFWFTLHLS